MASLSVDVTDDEIPVAEATVEVGMNRERIIRRIQAGMIRGRLIRGLGWVVERSSLRDLRGNQDG